MSTASYFNFCTDCSSQQKPQVTPLGYESEFCYNMGYSLF